MLAFYIHRDIGEIKMEINEKVLKLIIAKLLSFLNKKQLKEFQNWLKTMNIRLDNISNKLS
jgi:hypothetical protein